jgi:hypothetical protein
VPKRLPTYPHQCVPCLRLHHCAECDRQGFQPFSGKSSLVFWIRPNSGSTDPFNSSTPEGQVPQLKLFVMQDAGGNKKYCRNELVLGNSTQPSSQSGSWYLFQVREGASEMQRGRRMCWRRRVITRTQGRHDWQTPACIHVLLPMVMMQIPLSSFGCGGGYAEQSNVRHSPDMRDGC